MENLKSYLSDKRKGVFAAQIGIAPSYLSQILSGHRRPNFELMIKIKRETNNAVDFMSWAKENQE